MHALNILLVDDDRNLVTTLSHGLCKAMGEQVSVAVCLSGPEALSLLGDQAFDVVISDYNMPGTSGLELLRRIRRDHGEMALVLITAYGTDALDEGVRQLGGGYMTKPFEPSLLVEMIEELVQGEEAKGSMENCITPDGKAGETCRIISKCGPRQVMQHHRTGLSMMPIPVPPSSFVSRLYVR